MREKRVMSRADMEYEESKWVAICVLTMIVVCGITSITLSSHAYAEQSIGTPDSGVTSYTKSLYTTLQAAGYGSDTNTPDWGTYWNRISTAAQWAPSGTAAAGDVISAKTFYGSSRTQATGTFSPSASTATPAEVVTGKTFVGSTGAQQTGTYIPPAYGNCPTQAYHDSYGAPVTQTTNCTASITWTTASPSYTGDDKKDPVSGLVWSQALLNSAGTVTFTTGAPSAWSWDASAANNNAVGTKTASQLCSDRGNGWRLPTQKELMQAYIDGSNFNLTQPARYYWSANQYDSTDAWYVALGNGYTLNVSMVSTDSVRCVR